MPCRQRFNECYDDQTESVLGAVALVFIRAARKPLQRALLASTAPLFEPRWGGALDLFGRPRLPRTEVGNTAGKEHGKRLGERHGIGLVTRPRHALDAAQVHHQPDRALAEQTARPGVIEEGTLPDLGLGVVNDREIA